MKAENIGAIVAYGKVPTEEKYRLYADRDGGDYAFEAVLVISKASLARKGLPDSLGEALLYQAPLEQPLTEEHVRVLRVIEYTGPRAKVEDQVRRSLHGTRDHGNGVATTAVTLHEYPETLKQIQPLDTPRALIVESAGRPDVPLAPAEPEPPRSAAAEAIHAELDDDIPV